MVNLSHCLLKSFKELKLGLQAKRLSCHDAMANQFRLLLSLTGMVAIWSLLASIMNNAGKVRSLPLG